MENFFSLLKPSKEQESSKPQETQQESSKPQETQEESSKSQETQEESKTQKVSAAFGSLFSKSKDFCEETFDSIKNGVSSSTGEETKVSKIYHKIKTKMSKKTPG